MYKILIIEVNSTQAAVTESQIGINYYFKIYINLLNLIANAHLIAFTSRVTNKILVFI